MDSGNSAGMHYPSLPPSFLESLSFLDSPPLLPLAPSPAAISTPTAPPQLPCGGGSGAGKPRSSKKRSRASRRAPTTVLTTDTSNFRAMVQEFTGIPSPPFPSSSPTSSSSLLSRPRFPQSDAAKSPFLLRPSPQRLQNADVPLPPPSLTSPKIQQNPLFSFQSLLLSPKYNPSAMPDVAGDRSASSPPAAAMLTPEKYGMAGGVNIPAMVEPDGAQQERDGQEICSRQPRSEGMVLRPWIPSSD
ncbi:hypothetical protein AXF42_Ash019283 [Apostasia shenzhenica]|uniref:VQ domain-containing protein n=1 Tax=Apostasia shenzhenica TaxID=1088818 RepID=A0A2I0AR79_9ASPA|nr:hypothetical protein AXF42_Ash019283 [Apostasia shenzhenica]